MVTHEIVISSDGDNISDARELATRIHHSADILLERLLSHLSKLPEFPAATSEEEIGERSAHNNHKTDDNNDDDSLMLKRGVSLPVSAVAWIGDQLNMLDRLRSTPESDLRSDGEPALENQEFEFGTSHCAYDIESWLGAEAAKSMRYRLNLLRFLLPRVQLIRLTRHSWPPKSSSKDGASFLCSRSSSKKPLKEWWRKRQRQRRSILRDNNDETTEIPTETVASEFLRYAKRFEHGAPKCVNLLRVFPNATVLILESVPTSWIDMQGEMPKPVLSSRNQSQRDLRLISITNAAVYDLEDFLAPPAMLTSSPISQFQSPLSVSLTHLKLDNCSLGELTKGFASSLAQLVHLEYLSLRNNQFRSAKSLLRGLRPLTRLRYLDVSANRLVGCFGPFANLCLGGQVRTLKLSENLLTTCQHSGLEKCYALREIWLDSNCIEDVVEVSGLAQLPDLQCLALQRNPFSVRNIAALRAKPSTPPSGTTNTDAVEMPKSDTKGYGNQFYDPDWKIRLWTWFQHERQAVTPLELPVLNKKTKNMGLDYNGCDAATIVRMTREEWDRIQEETYSIATTASMTSSLSIPTRCIDAQTTEGALVSRLPRDSGETSVVHTASHDSASPILTTDASALGTQALVPVRNRKVTKKKRTRQAKIHATAYNNKDKDSISSTKGIHNFTIDRGGGRTQGKMKNNLSEIQADKISFALQKGTSPLTKRKESDKSPICVNAHNYSSSATSSRDKMNASQNESPRLSFSLQDVFISMQHEDLQQCRPTYKGSTTHGASIIENDDKVDKTSRRKESLPSMNCGKIATDEDVPNNPFVDDNISKDFVAVKKTNTETSDEKNREHEAGVILDVEDSQNPESKPLLTEDDGIHEKKRNKNENKKGKTQKLDKFDDTEHRGLSVDTLNTETTISNSDSPSKQSPQRSPPRSPQRRTVINKDRIFVRPKVTSIRLKRMGHIKPFDALKSDWEDLVIRASEGRIPDGLPTDFSMNTDFFSENVADLLPSNDNEIPNPVASKSVDRASGSRSSGDTTLDASTPSYHRLANALPEHVWEDDNSVLSSLGASRDDVLPREVNKFQLAEENCTYDGPDTSRGMKVVENLQLYFETFVFRTSMPDVPVDVLDELAKDRNDWQLIAIYYPRIQLWPDDRHLVELERARNVSSMSSADWTTNRERFLRVWKEDIVPCGKPALRRLPPNRRNRLGFHGDKLFENADVDAYAECRKVLLCLSSKAFYIIPEEDDVTMGHKQQARKRRFPLPLDRRDRFRDAPWPHAVARHCLGDLEAICIGFEFQRLILRFRNPSLPRSDPFVYVLLTGNKQSSVRIFQEIQKLAKDFSENNTVSDLGKSSSASTILIENDSQIVLDSLNNLIENTDNSGQGIGTIMHFQIVQQQWKRGDRGTVRRVCVVTDTMILLLDEDYTADGHDVSSVTVKGKHMADVRYRLVDQASLSLVSQVQAAGSDPRAITIIINPSKLSRTHRWRLICRDREGAESLVEDARKALENI